MNELELIGRLALAVLLAGLIGLERELRQKQAGLRTHALVGLGCAAMVLMGAYGFQDLTTHLKIQLDPTRVAGQVATGVGFIGAGVIFVREASVRGLTTAAGIWVAAAIGMVIGAGLYILAVGVALLALVVLEGFEAIERRLPTPKGRLALVRVSYRDDERTLARILELATAHGMVDQGVTFRRVLPDGVAEVEMPIPFGNQPGELLKELAKLPGTLETAVTGRRPAAEQP